MEFILNNKRVNGVEIGYKDRSFNGEIRKEHMVYYNHKIYEVMVKYIYTDGYLDKKIQESVYVKVEYAFIPQYDLTLGVITRDQYLGLMNYINPKKEEKQEQPKEDSIFDVPTDLPIWD